MARPSPKRYEICGACHLSTYSAGLLALAGDRCPRCGGWLESARSSRQTPSAKRLLDECQRWSARLGR